MPALNSTNPYEKRAPARVIRSKRSVARRCPPITVRLGRRRTRDDHKLGYLNGGYAGVDLETARQTDRRGLRAAWDASQWRRPGGGTEGRPLVAIAVRRLRELCERHDAVKVIAVSDGNPHA